MVDVVIVVVLWWWFPPDTRTHSSELRQEPSNSGPKTSLKTSTAPGSQALTSIISTKITQDADRKRSWIEPRKMKEYRNYGGKEGWGEDQSIGDSGSGNGTTAPIYIRAQGHKFIDHCRVCQGVISNRSIYLSFHNHINLTTKWEMSDKDKELPYVIQVTFRF